MALSAILDPFDSNQIMLCPKAVSFFQMLCPTLFSPISKLFCDTINGLFDKLIRSQNGAG